MAATSLLLLIPTAGHAQSTTRTACPGTFQVLHNDTVGALRLTAGAYQITVANPARLSCARAAQDLAEFLQDYDGKLRRPWNVNARAVAFQRGSDGQVSFSLARVGNATPGDNGGIPSPTSNTCPGFFRVLHSDHIGSLAIPKGTYRINLLSENATTCSGASRLFTQFLQDFDGRLVSPWRLNGTTATFTRGASTTIGFRIKRAVGPEPKPSSGGRFPARTQPGECPGTFRVLDNDRIANLRLPAGPYLTFTFRGTGVSCSETSQLFRKFLSGRNVPKGYLVAPATGVFSKGKTPVFRVKPASPRGNTAR